ncbi:HU family DNA-binding protein [uncultured Parabacteroides sp.]|uniref:HU family DNA-binding protein n=1 Tax=Parabacteroides goldsteinii TaxID=328812 RepID=UPI00259837DC|nr:HU family DNA-binding protein [uncultured Parabacteroides sp.]
MNKTEFINELAKRTDRPVTEMYKFVNDFFTLTTEILAREEDILFLGFGRFSPRKQNVRPVRNPKTGAPAMFYGRTTVGFKPGKDLLKTINRK